MKYYFILQLRMLNRHLADFGLNPIVGYFLSLLVFLGLSEYLFSKLEFAEYYYVIISISFLTKSSETNRNDFLKICFSDRDYLTIRVLENTIIAFPFFAFLLYKESHFPAAGVLISSIVLIFVKLENSLNYTMPTPFHKRPFEFVVGFRKAFFAFLFAYFLAVMAISVGNFGLGAFSLLFVFLISLTFYADPENEYYVWIFSLSPRNFLIGKIETALLFSTILSLPIAISLSIFFQEHLAIILGVQCLGCVSLCTVILAKYSAFPHRITLLQIALIICSISFPPLLIAVLPFFYKQSIKRLNLILE